MSIMTILNNTGYIPRWTPADRIRKARESKKLSQGEVARLTQLSARTIWMLESGQREPKEYEYVAIAKYTEVDEDWLKNGETPPNPDGPDGGKLLDLDSNQEPIGSCSGSNVVNFTPRQAPAIIDRRVA